MRKILFISLFIAFAQCQTDTETESSAELVARLERFREALRSGAILSAQGQSQGNNGTTQSGGGGAQTQQPPVRNGGAQTQQPPVRNGVHLTECQVQIQGSFALLLFVLFALSGCDPSSHDTADFISRFPTVQNELTSNPQVAACLQRESAQNALGFRHVLFQLRVGDKIEFKKMHKFTLATGRFGQSRLGNVPRSGECGVSQLSQHQTSDVLHAQWRVNRRCFLQQSTIRNWFRSSDCVYSIIDDNSPAPPMDACARFLSPQSQSNTPEVIPEVPLPALPDDTTAGQQQLGIGPPPPRAQDPNSIDARLEAVSRSFECYAKCTQFRRFSLAV